MQFNFNMSSPFITFSNVVDAFLVTRNIVHDLYNAPQPLSKCAPNIQSSLASHNLSQASLEKNPFE